MATPIPTNDPKALLPEENSGGTTPAQNGRVGMKIGKYVLGRILGRGGMGTVYEAEDSFLKRKVAIKVLPDSMATNGKAIRRFVLEARSFARVNHPNAVQIYEVDRRHEVCYLVMELMRGGSVQELLQAQGAMDWPEATQAVSDACRALAATHAAGLVHRDIKPGNLMRSADGVVKLADFGLAKDTESDQRSLTMPGGVVGTPSYMSPEQCRSEPVDARTDIYALGATYYTLLTGRPPYDSELPLQVLFAHCSAPVPDPRDVVPGVPGACVAIISRAMAKEPRDRYQTAVEMLTDLEAALSAGARSAIGDLGEGQTDAVLADLALAVSEPKLELGSNMPPVRVLAVVPSGDRPSADLAAPPATGSQRWPMSRGRWSNRWTLLLAILATAAVVLTVGVRHWGLLEVFGFESKRSSESTGPGDGAVTKISPPATTRAKPATRPSRVFTKYFGGVPTEGATLESGDNAVALAFSNDGGRLAIGRSVPGRAGGVKVYDTQSGKLVPAFYENRAVHALCFSPNGQKLAAGGDAGVIVRDGDLGWELSPPGGATMGPAWAIAFSPDGKWLAALTGADRKNRVIRIWDLTGWREIRQITAEGKALASLAFSPDGMFLAAGDEDGVNLWSTSTGKPLQSLPTGSRVSAIAFSRKGQTLALAVGATVQFWNTQGWTRHVQRWTLEGSASCLVYTANGKILACGTGDGLVRLWDIVGEKPSKILKAHDAPVLAIALSPDGGVLATAGSDKTVRLFDLGKTSNQSATKPTTKPLAKPTTKPTTKPSIKSVKGSSPNAATRPGMR